MAAPTTGATLLHPSLHRVAPVSYVVLGAAWPPRWTWSALGATLLAFFLAVGVSAATRSTSCAGGRSGPSSRRGSSGRGGRSASPALSRWASRASSSVGQLGCWPSSPAGVLFVVAYNLELLGGRLHSDFWFALSWGAFPVVTAYFAQTGRLSVAAVAIAAAAYALSFGQRA